MDVDGVVMPPPIETAATLFPVSSFNVNGCGPTTSADPSAGRIRETFDVPSVSALNFSFPKQNNPDGSSLSGFIANFDHVTWPLAIPEPSVAASVIAKRTSEPSTLQGAELSEGNKVSADFSYVT